MLRIVLLDPKTLRPSPASGRTLTFAGGFVLGAAASPAALLYFT